VQKNRPIEWVVGIERVEWPGRDWLLGQCSLVGNWSSVHLVAGRDERNLVGKWRKCVEKH
jgi:hypothetical protein